MSVTYRCPGCSTSLDGRPIFAFRGPPGQIECSGCRRVLATPFTYRMFWCYQLAVTTLFLPMLVWVLWGDRDKLGTLSTWITDAVVALFMSFIVGMVVALPLTFALRPARRVDP